MDKRLSFDVCIIGAGPGGYVAAIFAARQGMKVALIEEKALGGTCLNVGCIPTKTMASSADLLHAMGKAADFGIDCKAKATVNLASLISRKDKLIEKMQGNLAMLIKSNGVVLIEGKATFDDPYTLRVKGGDTTILSTKTVIIATGSHPSSLPHLPVDGNWICDSTALLTRKNLPSHLIVVGGGYIGCEFASIFSEFGSKVTIVEAMDRIIPLQSAPLSKALTHAFEKAGITLLTGRKVISSSKKESSVLLTLDDQSTLEGDCVLVAVGRAANTHSLQLEKACVFQDKRGFITVGEDLRTNQNHIFAIGDCNGRLLLAHAASHQGIVAAENAAALVGGSALERKMDMSAVPAVIFTHPEIAWVGLSLEEAEKAGYQAAACRFPMGNLGKSQVNLADEGYFELVYQKNDGRILGGFVVGKEASSLIGEALTAVHHGLSLKDLENMIHPHPTLTEGFHETAALGLGHPIHTLKKGSSKSS